MVTQPCSKLIPAMHPHMHNVCGVRQPLCHSAVCILSLFCSVKAASTAGSGTLSRAHLSLRPRATFSSFHSPCFPLVPLAAPQHLCQSLLTLTSHATEPHGPPLGLLCCLGSSCSWHPTLMSNRWSHGIACTYFPSIWKGKPHLLVAPPPRLLPNLKTRHLIHEKVLLALPRLLLLWSMPTRLLSLDYCNSLLTDLPSLAPYSGPQQPRQGRCPIRTHVIVFLDLWPSKNPPISIWVKPSPGMSCKPCFSPFISQTWPILTLPLLSTL